MSERILKALMQLFAIIAKIDDPSTKSSNEVEARSSAGHSVIRTFLRSEINPDKIEFYLELFDTNVKELRTVKKKSDGDDKRNSVNSVKILRICSEINEELTQRQKFIVLVRTLELILEDNVASERELEFVRTVAETFNIRPAEHKLIHQLLMDQIDLENPGEHALILTNQIVSNDSQKLHVHSLNAPVVVVHISSLNLLFFKYLGTDSMFMNGQVLRPHKAYLFNQGGSIKTNRSQPIYQSDLLNRFIQDTTTEQFTFSMDQLSYSFSGNKIGLHPLSFSTESGKLVGIMGGSGTGKSTLISILNGSLTPTSGSVMINGYNIHSSPKEIEGIIGYVSQDDLLIEELTVFQNIYYSAKLSFKDMSDREITKKVIRILHSLGLYDSRDLKVGNPLEKTISGGQRKRLNIGLELIREPAVLFVDEPTSGLSSRDSMNIMNLLKELSFRGKLIFVVIHQPSSEIFKLFNRLLLLDQGGYPIFDGNPVDSLVYFKSQLNFANADERECSLCGNVNPEQLFDIIEAKVVDEFGNSTKDRRTNPEVWYDRFKKQVQTNTLLEEKKDHITTLTNRPSRIKQFNIFFIRDLLSKISNKQYMFITLLEAPVLALVLAFFMKYFLSNEGVENYIFYKNENIPHFIFVSILVAIFFGMTVAAEEINKDKKILKREEFLNLSRGSYLFSKVIILALISLIQTGLFVAVGNSILEIKGMWLEYWLVLFSTSVCANLLGLNISSAFNLAKVIYILVPIVIIPQLLFSGALVKFDKLHPAFSHPTEVPWIGNLMLSRWSYEALAVEQASDNEFNKLTYHLRQPRSQATWQKDFWIPEMDHLARLNKRVDILKKEIQLKEEQFSNLKCTDCFDGNKTNYENIKKYLNILQNQYIKDFNEANDALESLKMKIGLKKYNELKETYANENLNNIVTNHFNLDKVVMSSDRLLQTSDPIYSNNKTVRFLDAPLYSKTKYWFGIKVSTFSANLILVWCYTLMAFIALYFDWLKKILDYSKKILSKK